MPWPPWSNRSSRPVERADALRLASGARVARLGTTTPDGRPHLVPITFTVLEDVLVTVVDAKPKRTRALRRLDNIRSDPRVTVLVDHYEEDWNRLWWVRIDGRATIAEGVAADHLAALAARYPQYRHHPPAGPTIVVSVESVTGWRYRADGARTARSPSYTPPPCPTNPSADA